MDGWTGCSRSRAAIIRTLGAAFKTFKGRRGAPLLTAGSLDQMLCFLSLFLSVTMLS